MSIEFNSQRSIDGLNTLSCDVINVIESIEIDGDNGNVNQLLTSTGTRTLWKDLSDLLLNLTAVAPLSFVAGSSYNGSVARALTIADGTIANVKLANSTISGKELGTNLETLNFDAPLSNFDYNGGTARTITIADGDIGNVKLANSTISGIELGTNLQTLNFDAPLSNLNYNGESARTITIADGDIGNVKLANSTISGKELGTDLSLLTFANGLVGANIDTGSVATNYKGAQHIAFSVRAHTGITVDGSGVSLTNSTISGIGLGSNLNSLDVYYGLTLAGAAYNGSAGRTLSLVFKSGGNISADGSGLFISNQTATLGSSSITLGATTEELDMTDDSGDAGEINNANLLSGSNLLPSERLAYYDTGTGSARWIYVLNSGDWHPNDDQSYFNICIDDEIDKVTGRGRTHTSSLEAMAVITIPNGWTPTAILVDVRDIGGSDEPEQLDVYKVKQWAGVNGTLTDLVGNVLTGSERTISSYGAADPTTSLLIKVHLNGTADYIGGGYIVLTPPS